MFSQHKKMSKANTIINSTKVLKKLEYGPMPNVMAALQNVGGALRSMPLTLADAQYSSALQ